VAIGKVIAPLPVTGLAANFSPIPRIAPPPLGSVIAGAAGDEGALVPPELLPEELPLSFDTTVLPDMNFYAVFAACIFSLKYTPGFLAYDIRKILIWIDEVRNRHKLILPRNIRSIMKRFSYCVNGRCLRSVCVQT
jgi:hypothetical protein